MTWIEKEKKQMNKHWQTTVNKTQCRNITEQHKPHQNMGLSIY